ncbi:beta strand repeat-containing protein [Jannaschia sp. 2305UL9-9]|uniref:beta strand repeat-containing protein n=1 Tax=Jannaschia sp. 2305UL9-9 TaxID=3121638 RepID=UPI003528E6CB
MLDPSLYTTVLDNTLLPYGQNLLAQGDDNEELFDISEIFEDGFSFGNRVFTELFLATNGGVSFLDPDVSAGARFETGGTRYVIAPFLDDLDNRTLPPGADPGIYFDTNTDRDSIVATWVGVGIFPNNITAPNTFQLEIMDLGEGDAEIIFRYSDMGNARTDTFQIGAIAEGFPALFLRGGTAGDAVGTAADIDTLTGNTGVTGVWQLRVIDGQLQVDDLLGTDTVGNGNANTINGTAFNDRIAGGAGNDTISGLQGIDRLSGDAGNDSLLGGDDDDILRGGDDNDILRGENQNDSLFGDAGDDSLFGNSGTNELDGGAGADSLDGSGGTSFAAYGSATEGLVISLSTPATNSGDAAGDTYNNLVGIIGSGFNDTITGNNSANQLRGSAGDDVIDALNGTDLVFGDAGDDTLLGGSSADTLVGGTGADNLNGGASNDFASYQQATMGLMADLADASANTGEAAGDTYVSIEGLLGGMGNDTLAGSANADTLSGREGDDMLIGRDGNDVLTGNEGNDTLNGGLGGDNLNGGGGDGDVASYVDATAGLTADLSNSAGNTGEATGDSYSGLEGLIGSAFGDTLEGDGGNNMLMGGDGSDRLIGNDGQDTLIGGAGADTLLGGNGVDTADYSSAASGVSASLFDPSGNTGDARGDTYSGIEQLIGSEFADTLGDGTGANGLFGLGGDDLFVARTGPDSYNGGDGIDTITFENLTTFVSIDMEDSSSNAGSATGLNLTEVENIIGTIAADDIAGDGQDNMLVGGGNNDTLMGRDGDDTLSGGAGNDSMTGGAGADSFMLTAGMGDDTVTDFTLGTDMLDMSALTSAEMSGITYGTNGAGDRVVTLADGGTLTLTGVPRNVEATGTPTVTGTATQGETLTAAAGDIADVDGLGTFATQWLRGGSEIAGATGDTYVLTQDDVGAIISARISFTDGYGSDEARTSAGTTAVANVNDPVSGSVTVSGTLAQNGVLTADTSGISDADGISGPIAVQWTRDGVDIAGATGNTLTLTQADVGGQIAARASYTDDFGAAEQSVSGTLGPVQNVNDAPTGAVILIGMTTVGQSLQAVVDDVDDIDGISGPITGQWLRGGTEIPGATNDTYVLTAADVGQVLSYRASYTDDGGTAETVTSGTSSVVVSGNLLINGTPDADRLVGGTGDDTINGNLGADTIIGDAGNDLITGGPDAGDLRDVVFAGAGDDTVRGGSGNDELRGDAGNDSLEGGIGADFVLGGAGNDTLTGGSLGDLLSGGDGIDFINGGFGFDRMSGGDGGDRFFHLGIRDHGSDWIQDYDASEGDVLVFGGPASATAANFQVNLATTPTAGSGAVDEAFVIYVPTGQIIWALVDGAGQTDINIQLASGTFDLV